MLSLRDAEYQFCLFRDYKLSDNVGKQVYLRHDIDDRPENALEMAIEENRVGIAGTYYFRNRKHIFIEKIIRRIEDLGHEIGYHYENLADSKGDAVFAIDDFRINLNRFRAVADVQTICMHGSPYSRWNNLDLWDQYSYTDEEVILEVFRDIDYNGSMYLTDTGRKWDSGRENMRDKVASSIPHSFQSTDDIIQSIFTLPSKLFITVHPQRWTDNSVLWIRELVMQAAKNVIKRKLIRH